ncbi:MAG: hypothetical protein Q8M22_13470 [Actinomycetota bacterium]|nr:hypothetical protein [Actinomycetota bacterium]
MNSPSPTPAPDPVRARRKQIAKYTLLANRVGYLFYALAIATFVIGFAVSFNAAVSAIVIGSLVIGSLLLAPAIVLGYAVKAAEREDRERGL